MVQFSGTLTTTGNVAITKPATDTLCQVQISGAYGTVSFVIEGTIDGTNWDGLTAVRADNAAFTSGTVSPVDNSLDVYDVSCPGYVGIRLRTTAVGSGTLAVFLNSGAFVGIPAKVQPNSTQASVGAAGSDLAILGGLALTNITTGITAFAGGGQGSAVALTTTLSQVNTVGTAADSVKLPAATAGKVMIVENAAAANSMNVFPNTGDAINALSANSAFAVAANKCVIFICFVAGTWKSITTA